MTKQQKIHLAQKEFDASIEEFSLRMQKADLPWIIEKRRFTPGMAVSFGRYLSACERLNNLL